MDLQATPKENQPSSPSRLSRESGDAALRSGRMRQRAKAPKVRTGCANCKRRHIRCDESKPACLRCVKHGTICEGYAIPPPKQRRKKLAATPVNLAHRTLLPMPTGEGSGGVDPDMIGEDRTTARAAHEMRRLRTLREPSSLGFHLTEDEVRYFDLFRHQMIYDFSPYFTSIFWSQTALREALAHRCIRHSVLAIGAYSRAALAHYQQHGYDAANTRDYSSHDWSVWSQHGRGAIHVTSARSQHPAWPETSSNAHFGTALRHQMRALAELRRAIDEKSIGMRTAMVATLLLFAFESMQGHTAESHQLLRTGMKMFMSPEIVCGSERWRTLKVEDSIRGPASPRSCLHMPQEQHAARRQNSHNSKPITRMASRPPYYSSSKSGKRCSQPVAGPAPLRETNLHHEHAVDEELHEMTHMLARHASACMYSISNNRIMVHFLAPARPLLCAVSNQSDGTTPSLEAVRRHWDFLHLQAGVFCQKAVRRNMCVEPPKNVEGYWSDCEAEDISLEDLQFDGDGGALAEQMRLVGMLAKFGKLLDVLVSEYSERLSTADASLNEQRAWDKQRDGISRRGLLLMRAQHLAMSIFTTHCLDPSELSFDSCGEQFSKLFYLIKQVVALTPSPSTSPLRSSDAYDAGAKRRPLGTINWTLECGVLQLLAFIAGKCRSRPPIRRAAALLMQDLAWRESSWDGWTKGVVMQTLLRLETEATRELASHDRSSSRNDLTAWKPPDDSVQKRTHETAEKWELGDGDKELPAWIPPEARYCHSDIFIESDSRGWRVYVFKLSKILPNEDGVFEMRTFTADA